MSEPREVLAINSLKAMAVLSLATGNMLGRTKDFFIHPTSGVLLGLTVVTDDGSVAVIDYDRIYSFGRDAIMAEADGFVRPIDPDRPAAGQSAQRLFGTKVITESGDEIGQITNIFVTLKPPPFVLYEVRRSIMDKLLGREFFIPGSAGHALSEDAARLVVPDVTAEAASSDLASLTGQTITVRTHGSPESPASETEDETVLREPEEDETVTHVRDGEETLLRPPR